MKKFKICYRSFKQSLNIGEINCRTEINTVGLIKGISSYVLLPENFTRKQVSFLIGDSHGTYSDLETEKTTHTPANLGTRICTLFKIPLSVIQDAYAAFLEAGQGSQIPKLRESLHMSETEFAHHLGVRPFLLHKRKTGMRVVSRATWERYFK